jgi:hypothetical protein
MRYDLLAGVVPDVYVADRHAENLLYALQTRSDKDCSVESKAIDAIASVVKTELKKREQVIDKLVWDAEQMRAEMAQMQDKLRQADRTMRDKLNLAKYYEEILHDVNMVHKSASTFKVDLDALPAALATLLNVPYTPGPMGPAPVVEDAMGPLGCGKGCTWQVTAAGCPAHDVPMTIGHIDAQA